MPEPHDPLATLPPTSRARVEALLKLPVEARRALWLAAEHQPGWAYWMETPECRACEGTTHEECLDCDDRRWDHNGGDESPEAEWTSHCTCPYGESWPCTAARCEACGGTGDGPVEWCGMGLALCHGMAFGWHRKVALGAGEITNAWFDRHLWCPYAPSDVLRVAADALGKGSSHYLRVLPLPTSDRRGVTARVGRPRPGDDDLAFTSFPPSLDPLLAALDVLRQVWAWKEARGGGEG